MLAAEMGVTAILPEHPEASAFLPDRPFLGEAFDLVFCDGQVLRTHRRPEWRARYREAGRLSALLHKADAWRSVELLHAVRGFAAAVALFKPAPMHAKKSSFYLVATGVQPDRAAARAAVEKWKRDWYVATFGTLDDYRRNRVTPREVVEGVLDDFGEELCRLGGPVWEIQEKALRRAVKSAWGSQAKQPAQEDARAVTRACGSRDPVAER